VVLSALGCAAQPASEAEIAEESAADKSDGDGTCPYGTETVVDGEVWCDISSDGSTEGSSSQSTGGSSSSSGGGGVGCPGGTYAKCSGGYCYPRYLTCCEGRVCAGGPLYYWATDPGSTLCRTEAQACDDRCAMWCTG
jgi:hypothetical protein